MPSRGRAEREDAPDVPEGVGEGSAEYPFDGPRRVSLGIDASSDEFEASHAVEFREIRRPVLFGRPEPVERNRSSWGLERIRPLEPKDKANARSAGTPARRGFPRPSVSATILPVALALEAIV